MFCKMAVCDGCHKVIGGIPVVTFLGKHRRDFCEACSSWAFWAIACELTGEQAESLMKGFEAKRQHEAEKK